MEKRKPTQVSKLYTPRTGNLRIGDIVIGVKDEIPQATGVSFALIGCSDDRGVVLNHGRHGAMGGPDSIRKFFYKLSVPESLKQSLKFYDLGNILPSPNIVETHQRAQSLIELALNQGHTVLNLGGGHDFAAPSLRGLYNASKQKKKIGCINVDPHLDVRPLEKGLPHSGSPFREVIEEKLLLGKHFVEFGARQNRNDISLFEFCKANNVKVVELDTLLSKTKPIPHLYKSHLAALAKKCHSISTTFDIDACFEAEGSSAAPVLGFSAYEMCLMSQIAGKQKKTTLFEICEVAPEIDPFERSSRIAAEMLFYFIKGRMG